MRSKRRKPAMPQYIIRDKGAWRIVGALLIAAGLLLLFLCIPGWAWAALAGVLLVAAGYILISLGGR
ncbi:MAG: hypothetical protein IJ438_03965 [Clostridia bacterium]|nr:hypothetical protein [Clostridia bacterium]